MEQRTKVSLNEDEKTIIIRALNDLRNSLLREERSTDAVDDLMIRIYEGGRTKMRVAEEMSCDRYR
jgi:hypothetical protein